MLRVRGDAHEKRLGSFPLGARSRRAECDAGYNVSEYLVLIREVRDSRPSGIACRCFIGRMKNSLFCAKQEKRMMGPEFAFFGDKRVRNSESASRLARLQRRRRHHRSLN